MLILFRRHRKKCKHASKGRSYRHCNCPLWVQGTVGGRTIRKSMDLTAWEAGQDKIREWEAAGEITADPKTIKEAVDAFVADCADRNIREATLRKYKTFTNQLQAYCEDKKLTLLSALTPEVLRDFRSSWNDAPRAAAKKLERLRAFGRFCADNEWLPKNPAAKIKAPQGSNAINHKSPFTDEELARILAACDKMEPTKWKNDRASGEYTGRDIKDFIQVLTYTGLRISDVAGFRIDRLNGNECFLFQHKTGKPLSTWLPDWLRDRLQQRAMLYGRRIFALGASERVETITDLWRRKLNKVSELAEQHEPESNDNFRFEEKPTPHRFRHTFARILLERGVPIADVAELIGDTEEMVRKHYARWVPERQARLTSILKEAFSKGADVILMPKRDAGTEG